MAAMKTVTVLMSTYNGEKYLEEQIESILNQKGVNVKLLVRDDGSRDGTVKILNQYKSKGLLEYIVGDNIGFAKSFLYLFGAVKEPTDYYAFSDQDDIWNESKLYEAIKCLERMNTEKEKGKLYFSNLYMVDKDKNYMGFKALKNIKITLGSAYVRGRVSGCTMVMDTTLFQLTRRLELRKKEYNCKGGYEWAYLICLAVGGEIYYDYHAYIDFRRHGDNVTASGNGFLSRIKNELKAFGGAKNDRSELSKVLLTIYSNEIEDNNRKLIQEVAEYRSSWWKRIKLLFNSELDSNMTLCNLEKRIYILLGVF